MKKRNLLPLFLINFIVYFVGTGLMPVLPLYAAKFGVSSTGIGLYIAAIFAAITLGAASIGSLTRRFSSRNIFIASGILGIPALASLGRSTSFWQVIVLTAAVWFLAGVGTSLVGVQAGLLSSSSKRGRSFGLMFLALPVASLISGLTVGRLVEWQSYRFMFDVLAVFWAAWPLLAVVGPNNKPDHASALSRKVELNNRPPFGVHFSILILTTMLAATAFYLTRLGTTFSLSSLGFSPSAVASTTSIGGLVAIPATYLIGVLSDRMSRNLILAIGYAFAVGAALIMSVSSELWHFWLATAMLFMSRSVNGSVAPAKAADLLDKEELGHGLPYLSASNWMAGIFGSAIAGIGIDNLGQTNNFLLATAFAAAAILLFGLTVSMRKTVANSAVQPSA